MKARLLREEESHPSDPVEDEKIVEELDLGLPAPEETLRKVDALLAGKGLSGTTSKTEISSEKVDPNATTTVVANVMIGIGNKPFLRGEGPGLSWDEGVSMNFIEIGKWAWSPPRKNASLTVQVYRNDQDPDKGGKVVVKPGQKLEITYRFLLKKRIWIYPARDHFLDGIHHHRFIFSVSHSHPLAIGQPCLKNSQAFGNPFVHCER